RDLLLIIALITALGVAVVPINPSAAVYFIYAASFAGNVERPFGSFPIVGGVLAVLVADTLLLHFPVYFVLYASVLTLAIGTVNVLYGQRHRDRKKLQRAEEEVRQLSQIAERGRIASDLPDM